MTSGQVQKRWSHAPANWPMRSQCPHVNECIAFPSVVIRYLPGTQHWHVLSGWPDICIDTGWEMESLYYQLLKWLVFSGAERNWIYGIQTHNLIAISAALCGGLSWIPIDSLSPSLQVDLTSTQCCCTQLMCRSSAVAPLRSKRIRQY